EEVGERAIVDEDARVVLGQSVLANETRTTNGRQLGDRGAQALDVRPRWRERDEVGLGEVPVILHVLLRPLEERLLSLGAPAHGDLSFARAKLAARLPLLPQPVGLVRHGLLERGIAVHVLDLALRGPASLTVLCKTDRHVDVEAPCALFE